MFETVQKIENTKPEFCSDYQSEILEHWEHIQNNKRYPHKEDFRPQKFPKYLAKIAIVSVNRPDTFSGRLTGETVSDILRLEPGSEKLLASPDKNIKMVVRSMLDQTKLNGKPTYFEGKFLPEYYTPINFSALVLPFCYEEHGENMDTLLLAFEFKDQAPIAVLD